MEERSAESLLVVVAVGAGVGLSVTVDELPPVARRVRIAATRSFGEEARRGVAVVLQFNGATLDQYDQVIEKMGFERGGTGAPGGLFHWVTATDDGIRITDVWESREQFETFAEEQIGPYTKEAGIPSPPKVTFHDVHNYLTAG